MTLTIKGVASRLVFELQLVTFLYPSGLTVKMKMGKMKSTK